MRADHPLASRLSIDYDEVSRYPILTQSGPLPKGADVDAAVNAGLVHGHRHTHLGRSRAGQASESRCGGDPTLMALARTLAPEDGQIFDVILLDPDLRRRTRCLDLLGAREDQIEAVSLGEEKPRCSEGNEGCWSQNRRDDMLYTGEF